MTIRFRMDQAGLSAADLGFGRLLGATRYVWNWSLARRSAAWREREERMNWVTLSRDFTLLRKAEGTAWLSELPREPFNQVLREVQLRRSEDLAGRLRSVTLRRDGAGRWFATLTADGVPKSAWGAAGTAAVGVDAGLRDLLVIADGVAERRVPAPKALAGKLVKLRRYQRRQTRQIEAQMRSQGLDPSKPCPKGVRLGVSGRRRRTQRRIARLHTQIADVRREATHMATSQIVREAQVICLEDLAVQAMSRGMGRKSFRRSVADASLGEVRRQLVYKAQWQERTISVVDRFYPSSKTCSDCGSVNADLKLEKQWVCPQCGQRHDRDSNAAKNIRSEGLRLLGVASLPATPRSGGSDARGVASAVDGRRDNAGDQHRPTMNREPAVAVQRRTTGNGPKAHARPHKPCLELGTGRSG